MNEKVSPETEPVGAVSLGAGGKDALGADLALTQKYLQSDIKKWLGTSMGGFIAVLAANDFNLEEMISALYDLWHPSLGVALRGLAPKFVNPFKVCRGDQEEVRKLCANFGLLYQTEHVAKWVAKYNLQWNNASLGLLDVLSGEHYVADKDSGISLEVALASTMAVPGVFAPQPWREESGQWRLFVDGGVRHMHPHVDGHKTAIVKALRFPGRDRLFKDVLGDVVFDIGVVPTLGVLFPPSRKEIEKQVREAQERLSQSAA